MKAKIEVELRPWMTPNFACSVAPENTVEAASIPLKDLDAATLGRLCDEFRVDVFKKAGKPDPRLKS